MFSVLRDASIRGILDIQEGSDASEVTVIVDDARRGVRNRLIHDVIDIRVMIQLHAVTDLMAEEVVKVLEFVRAGIVDEVRAAQEIFAIEFNFHSVVDRNAFARPLAGHGILFRLIGDPLRETEFVSLAVIHSFNKRDGRIGFRAIMNDGEGMRAHVSIVLESQYFDRVLEFRLIGIDENPEVFDFMDLIFQTTGKERRTQRKKSDDEWKTQHTDNLNSSNRISNNLSNSKKHKDIVELP